MPPLLWIVKTAESKSLSHSEEQERLQVFSQARRNRRRQKSEYRKQVSQSQKPRQVESVSTQENVSSSDSSSDVQDDGYGTDETSLPLGSERDSEDGSYRVSTFAPQSSFSKRPSRTLNAYQTACPNFTLDNSKIAIFNFFVNHWMPSKNSSSLACVSGFSPVKSGDMTLSTELVREAFQNPSEVSLYSLLTVCSRRMRVVHGSSSGRELPEVYANKALVALRSNIESQQRLSSRLILDISYLFLSEVYVRPPDEPNTYGEIIRGLIIRFGGIQALPVFTAQACLAWDLTAAATKLTIPKLDPYRTPELLLTPAEILEMDADELAVEIYLRMQQLNERPRVLALQLHNFTRVIQAFEVLPLHVQDLAHSLAQEASIQTNKLFTCTLRWTSSILPPQSDNSNVNIADINLMHLKMQMYLVWLWYSFLGASTRSSMNLEISHTLPRAIQTVDSQLSLIVDTIEILRRTGWAFRDDILLWFLAVVALSATDPDDSNKALRLFSGIATRTNMRNEREMNGLIAKYPNLKNLLARVNQVSFWDVLDNYRSQSRSSIARSSPSEND